MQIEFKEVPSPYSWLPSREHAFLNGEIMRTGRTRSLSSAGIALLKPLADGQFAIRAELLVSSGLWAGDTIHMFETRMYRLRRKLARFNLAIVLHAGRGYRLEKIEEQQSRAA